MNKLVKESASASNVSGVIDVVRGLAILIVVMVHLRNSISFVGGFHGVPDWFMNVIIFLGFGNSGVGLFFFISGFLLDFLYRKNFAPKKYVVRRVGRIVPAWVLWNIVAVLVAWAGLSWGFAGGNKLMEYVYGSAVAPTSLHNIGMILLSVLFLGWLNYSVWNTFVPGGWSIQTEIYHYVLFPVFNKISLSLSLVLLFGMQVLMWFVSVTIGEHQIASAFLTSPYWFMSGVLLSRVLRRVNDVSEENEIVKPVNILLFIAATGVTLMVRGPFVPQWVTMLVVIFGLFFAFIIQRQKGLVSRIFKSIGTYSYGMYFNHFILVVPLGFVVVYLARLLPDSWYILGLIVYSIVGFILSLVISFFFAKIVYKFYEKPMLDKARKI